MFSKREAAAFEAVPLDLGSVAEGLQRARHMYRQASEDLFQFCYYIQVTGELPDPVALTKTLLQYRHAVDLIEALNLQDSCDRNEESLVGTPVRSR
jgi:hypothetical protein